MSAGTPVIVIGAGIAGLTAAFRLHQAGCRVVVLEREGPEWIGGRMATIERGGFHINIGAALLPGSYRRMARLVEDVGAADQVLPTGDTFGVYRGGAVQHLRTGSKLPNLFRPYVRDLPLSDLAKVGADFLRIKSKLGWDDMTGTAPKDLESVRDYCLRRGLRPDVFEHLIAPFTAGPALAEPESATIVNAFFSFNVIVSGGPGFTSREGVGFLPKALAAHVSVRHHAEVTSVEVRNDEAVVTWTSPESGEHVDTAAAVVVAVAPPHAASLCAGLPAALSDYFRQTRYSRALHIAFGLSRPTEEPSLLLQVPRIEHPDIVAYVLEHNQARERVPRGTGLVMAQLREPWAAEHWEQDDQDVVDHVLTETGKLGILPELHTDTVLTEVIRVPQCTLIRRPGEYRHAARVAQALSSQAPLYFAGGDYLSQSSTNGSLVSGEKAAARVLEGIR